ncbi:MAG: hypothetical protein WCD79_13775 [Chthoniobacteraceae bacterium]
MSERIDKLKGKIEQKIEGRVSHVESVPVTEMFRGKILWDGTVETFDLSQNPMAKRCYAWSYEENNETHYVTALAIPPVDSAVMAVKMYIASLVRHRNDRGVVVL